MTALLEVVIPVFLVTAAGYAAIASRFLPDAYVDALNAFAQKVAVPCLLFTAALRLDLGAVFDPALLFSFYAGNTSAFLLGMLGARLLFRRRPGEAVSVGFGALFSNSVILGMPIITRAYGGGALDASIAVVSIHAPYCYFLGITVMEISRADGRGFAETAKAVIRAMTNNALMIGLALGFAGNLLGLRLPAIVEDALGLLTAAALPVALFGLGGVLTRYSLRRSLPEATMTTTLSLVVHPAITFVLAHHVFALPVDFVRGAVLTAAMAPGVNSYIFATMYDRAVGAAASTVLMATVLSVASISVWIQILNAL